MKIKTAIMLSCVAIIIGFGLAGALVFRQPGEPAATAGQPAAADEKPTPVLVVAPAPDGSPQTKANAPAGRAPAPAQPPVGGKSPATPASDPAAPVLVINGYEVQDPMARVALGFVGSDPEANAYWLGAINDPAMPPEERKDLIEDLNEDGLSDPDHPSAQDLPTIVARLQILEQLLPNALDDVNREAMAEAYKDLYNLLHGQGPN
jgi:hypothetical protein